MSCYKSRNLDPHKIHYPSRVHTQFQYSPKDDFFFYPKTQQMISCNDRLSIIIIRGGKRIPIHVSLIDKYHLYR